MLISLEQNEICDCSKKLTKQNNYPNTNVIKLLLNDKGERRVGVRKLATETQHALCGTEQRKQRKRCVQNGCGPVGSNLRGDHGAGGMAENSTSGSQAAGRQSDPGPGLSF